MPQSLIPKTYQTLVAKISKELSELEFFIKRRTAETYWNIGKYIHAHLLENKERAQYGATLYEHLAKDVDRDISTLQRSVQFYRAYPIPAEQRELTWDHYKSLIAIKDQKERKRIEEKVIREGWSTIKLREYLGHQRELAALNDDDKPVPRLSFTRGRPGVCPLAAAASGVETHGNASLPMPPTQTGVCASTAPRFIPYHNS